MSIVEGATATDNFQNSDPSLETKRALQSLFDQMFQKNNFETDSYIRASLNGAQAIPFELLIQAPQVMELSSDSRLIREVLLESKVAVITEDGIRPFIRPEQNTLILRDISKDSTEDAVRGIFASTAEISFPPVTSVRPDLNDTWFVSFSSEADARLALETVKRSQFDGKPVRARLKTESLAKLNNGSPGSDYYGSPMPFSPGMPPNAMSPAGLMPHPGFFGGYPGPPMMFPGMIYTPGPPMMFPAYPPHMMPGAPRPMPFRQMSQVQGGRGNGNPGGRFRNYGNRNNPNYYGGNPYPGGQRGNGFHHPQEGYFDQAYPSPHYINSQAESNEPNDSTSSGGEQVSSPVVEGNPPSEMEKSKQRRKPDDSRLQSTGASAGNRPFEDRRRAPRQDDDKDASVENESSTRRREGNVEKTRQSSNRQGGPNTGDLERGYRGDRNHSGAKNGAGAKSRTGRPAVSSDNANFNIEELNFPTLGVSPEFGSNPNSPNRLKVNKTSSNGYAAALRGVAPTTETTHSVLQAANIHSFELNHIPEPSPAVAVAVAVAVAEEEEEVRGACPSSDDRAAEGAAHQDILDHLVESLNLNESMNDSTKLGTTAPQTMTDSSANEGAVAITEVCLPASSESPSPSPSEIANSDLPTKASVATWGSKLSFVDCPQEVIDLTRSILR